MNKFFENKHILIINENLPSPFDTRTWRQATTLSDNGALVSIICPKTRDFNKKYEVINNIHIYRHPLPVEASTAKAYIIEYAVAFFWQLYLSLKIYRKKKFQVIQGCNPPDLIYLIALPFKAFKVKYVFDHRDLNPELYEAKFNKHGFFYKLMFFFEKHTYKHADYSIATNISYQEIAIKRGKIHPDKVMIVRGGPQLERLRITQGNLIYKKGRKFLIGYLGVIGDQEGIDLLFDAFKLLLDKKYDVQLAIVGGGTSLNKLKELSVTMGLKEHVDFYGRVSDELLVDILNTADICVNPDRPTTMNNLSTMNKIMEYMALKKPIVQFDLKEGKFSAQNASLYAEDTADFAEKIESLLNNPDLRREMGEIGYARVVNELSWEHESKKLVDFYKKIFLCLIHTLSLCNFIQQ